MNLKKYKRFFAFGCSFTAYNWPTWADAIAHEIPESYNYGKPGAGNFYIFSSIIEANITHKFTEDDLIIVMWSSIDREDRYIEREWKAVGSVYHSQGKFYDNTFIKKYVDPRGCFIRDANTIAATTSMLDGLDFHFLSMLPFVSTESYKVYTAEKDLVTFYKDVLDIIKPSVQEVVYNFDWGNRKNVRRKHPDGVEFKDLHPTPNMHVEYLQKSFPDLALSTDTIKFMDTEDKNVFANTFFDPSKYTFNRPHITRL